MKEAGRIFFMNVLKSIPLSPRVTTKETTHKQDKTMSKKFTALNFPKLPSKKPKTANEDSAIEK